MPVAGTKSTEFAVATSMEVIDEFLANINNGTARIALANIPELASLMVFLVANAAITLSEAAHYRRLLNLNNAAGAIALTLPDIDSVLQDVADDDIGDLTRGGLFCTLIVGSGATDVTLTCATTGQLRGSGPSPQASITADTLYVGAKQSLADEAVVRIYKRASTWVADCSKGFRTTSSGDTSLIVAASLGRDIDVEAAQNRVLIDGDHMTVVWLTDADPGTLTFQSDIAIGTVITVVNAGSNAVTINEGSHTLLGDGSIPAEEAATIIVGPTVSSTNRKIFIAASS